MRTFGPALSLAVALCPALASAKPKPVAKPMPPVHYICEDGTRLAIAYSAPGATPGTAVLRILGTGKEIKLEQAPSADGGRYTGGSTEFWDKGQTASYTQDGTALNCHVKR